MGGRLLEGPAMAERTLDWRDELGRWLKPFLARLGHKARRQMCPLYVSGLIGPGDRKSVQPMAKRLALGACDQLHHFIAAGVWDAGPLETELLVQADKLVGGSDAVLVIDDTAIPKKGTHSVGVAAQYASALGKTANCQTLVSLTLARGEVPVMLALRLFLPESWTSNRARLDRAGVPAEYRTARTKPELALVEIDRAIAAGVCFGCVLADAGYGLSAPFRHGLTARKLAWAVGIPRHLKVYPADVRMIWPVAKRGRPRQRHVPDILSIPAEDMLANAKWHTISWRNGTKGKLKARFAAVRVRVADGPPQRLAYRRTQDVGREEILSRQPAGEDRPAHLGSHHQGALDLRAGSPAAERRTRSRSLRGAILARASPSRAYDNDRLRLPPAPPSRNSEAEKKESTARRLSQLWPPCATQSSNSSLDCRRSDARIVENGCAPSGGVSKSAKVVLEPVDIVLCGGLYAAVIDPAADASPQAIIDQPGSWPMTGARAIGWALKSPIFWALAIALTAYWLVFSAFIFHAYPLLLERGFDTQAVVFAMAVIGPAQSGRPHCNLGIRRRRSDPGCRISGRSRISSRLSRTDGYTASVSGSRADRSDLWRSEWDHDHCSWSRGSGNADTRCLRGHQWRPGRADDGRESSSSLRGSTALGRIGLIRLRADRDAWRVAVACYCVLGFCVSGHSS